MAITKRATKGSALTFAELDANFTHFEGLLPAFAGQINGANGTWTGSTGISGARNSAGTYTLTFSSAFSAATDYHVQATIQDAGNTQQDIEITRSTSNVILEVRTSADDGDSSVTDGTAEDETISIIIYTNTTTTGGGAAITNLTSLSDVSVSSPQNGQILQYNTSSGFFENVTSSVSNAFTGLTDTPSSFGTTGQYLAVNSAGNALEFVSNTFAEINLADDQQAKIGLGDDLLIFHESSSNNSIIRETNSSGDLLIQANNLKLQKGDGQEDYLVATSNGSVAIKHDNATKLETTSSGIDVTGLVEFDSLSGTGSVAITDIYDQDDMASNSATALATQQSIKKYVDDQVIEGILVEGTTNEVNVSVNAGTFTVGLPDNVTVAGNLTVTGNIVPTNNETQDIGSASKRFKDIFLKGSTIDLGGTLITKDSSGNIELKDSGGTAKSISTATLVGTELDVNGNADISGNLTGVSAITASGAITGGSFVIGSADISEAELETIDGVTAGTVSASKAVVVDANKDVTGFRNVTVAGNLTVNGTTTTVATTNTTVSDKLLELGTGTTGSASGDAGIVIERGDDANAFIGFDESADKFIVGTGTFTGASTGDLTITTGTLVSNLEGNVTGALTGNADTATTATNVVITDNESTAEDNALVFVAGADVDGSTSAGLESDGTLTYNPSTGKVTATGFVGALTGNADTATTATTATNVVVTDNENTSESNAIVFVADADVDGSTSTGLESDGTLTYNPSTGKITATGFIGALTGNADTATTATNVVITDNENTDESNALVFVAGADVDGSTSAGLESDGTLTYNPSTGLVSATGFVGSLTGLASTATAAFNVITSTTGSGDQFVTFVDTDASNTQLTRVHGEVKFNTGTATFTVAGTVSATSLAGTLTTAAQTNITSVGALTSLTMAATSATVGGKILFKEGTNGGTNAVSLIGPATTADVDILLPNAAGTIVLKDSTDTLTNKSIDAGQLTGTIDNARLPAAATNITSVGTLTALTVDNIAINGTTIGHTSDTDILTFANAEPRLTVNASAMEIVDTNAGDNPGPNLSLYRNSSSPANSDELGRILFLGQNDAGEKTYYAQIATEISSSGVDDGGEASAIRFHVTDGGSGVDNTVTDLTEDQFTIGPSDTGVLTLTSGGATVGGSVGLMLGSSGNGIRFEGSNLGEGNSSYENFLRQQEPTQASVNSGDNHSYQMLPRGSGVLLRSRGSSQIDDANVDKTADTVTFSSAHGLRTGDQVVYNDAYSTSLEISNVDADCQTFFAIVTSTTAIKLASSLSNALAGTALDIDDDGADNQSFLFPHQMDNPIQMRDQVFEVGHKTTTERDALAAPTKHNGALIYNDTTESLNAYVGGNAWGDVEVGVLASNAIITGTSIAHGVFTTYRGKKVVFTGSGNCTVQLPNVQGGTSDIGATWTICNAGSANVILDLNGSGTTQTLKILTGASVATASADPHIAPGGVASLICIQGSTVTVSNYILFGSGVVDNS